MPCGIKLPGPRAQTETSLMISDKIRDEGQVKEYVRLFQRFRELRPYDPPEEIEKLVELVENGTLKEHGDTFIVLASVDCEIDYISNIPPQVPVVMVDWEASSHTTTRIKNSEFEEEHCGVLGLFENEVTDFGIPRQYIPLSGSAPVTWPYHAMNMNGSFRWD
jgi:hypothetical protein